MEGVSIADQFSDASKSVIKHLLARQHGDLPVLQSTFTFLSLYAAKVTPCFNDLSSSKEAAMGRKKLCASRRNCT